MEKEKKSAKEIIKKHYGYLVVDEEYFELDVRGTETIFKKVSKSQARKKIKLMLELSKELKKSLDAEAVMMEALSRMQIEELESIHDKVFNIKKKTKPETRKHHCVDMKVGNFIIPIVD